MMPPAKPFNEAARLAALHAALVLDTPAEEMFDRVTALAAAMFDVPVSLLSLIDGERQWFKSRYGWSNSEEPRDQSFCGHAILHPHETMVVCDARNDIRFHDNPLVIGGPRIRFYAGHPIKGPSGLNVGTLIGGAIVVEVIFGIPGMGQKIGQAIFSREYVELQSCVVVIAVLFVLINFLIDFLYSVVDPRIRRARATA